MKIKFGLMAYVILAIALVFAAIILALGFVWFFTGVNTIPQIVICGFIGVLLFNSAVIFYCFSKDEDL